MNDNFKEIVKGFTEKQAVEEANRCLNCKTKPCEIKGCPANVKIPEFIQAIKNKNYELAYEIINKNNCFPSITGRVCPQELQCEAKCVRGIKSTPVKIGMLERFIGDYFINKKSENKITKNKKVAVIGSGPAGLSCANKLASSGYSVTVFDNRDVFGGILSYGIPKFRLPQHIVENYIKQNKIMGVKFDNITHISVENIKKMGFSAIFLAIGTSVAKKINMENQNLKGVFYANDILYKINLDKQNIFTQEKLPKKILVVGGGNVAMDVARCCKRLGIQDVQIVYRRFEKNMPARKDEIEHTKEDGIIFNTGNKPIKFISDEDGNVKGIECVKMKLLYKDEKETLVEILNSNFIIESENIIIAIGNETDINVTENFGVLTDENNNIIVNNETYQTSIKGIFAGGDVVTGSKTVILAIKSGQQAAESIIYFLNK